MATTFHTPIDVDKSSRGADQIQASELDVGFIVVDEHGEDAFTVLEARPSSRYPDLVLVETTAGTFYKVSDEVFDVSTDSI